MSPSAATPGGHVRFVALALLGAALLAFPAQAIALTSTGTPTLVSNNATPTLAKSGDVLTCGPSTWSSEPDSRSWWWKRGTTVLTGNTTNQYAVQDADTGQSISCSVTANFGGSEVSSPYSTEIAVPALPTVAFGQPTQGGTTTDTIASGGSWSLPWTLSGGSLTGCTLDGLAVLCSGGSYAFDAGRLTNKADHTFAITARNAAGASATTTKTFRVAVPVLPRLGVGEQSGRKINPGDLVKLNIETDAGARVACKVNGEPVACTTSSVSFPASLPTTKRPSDVVVVTATNDDGSTTVTRTITVTGNQKLKKFPNPIAVEVGTLVKLRTDLDFGFWADGLSAYRFVGDVPGITWTEVKGSGAVSDATEITFTAPSKTGTFTSELRWGNGGFFLEDELVVKTFTADQIRDTLTFDGITDARKPLTCPGRKPFVWYLNGVLRFQTEAPYLPGSVDLTKTVVSCTSTDPATGRPMSTQALVAADGTELTAAPTGTTVTLEVSRPSTVTATYSARPRPQRRPRPAPRAEAAASRKATKLGSVTVKVRKGRSAIKLPAGVRRKLRGRDLQISVRVVGRNGKRSPAITLDAG